MKSGWWGLWGGEIMFGGHVDLVIHPVEISSEFSKHKWRRENHAIGSNLRGTIKEARWTRRARVSLSRIRRKSALHSFARPRRSRCSTSTNRARFMALINRRCQIPGDETDCECELNSAELHTSQSQGRLEVEKFCDATIFDVFKTCNFLASALKKCNF